MKAKAVDSVPKGDWIYEIQFDGYRALALRGGNETRVLSRNQKDLGSKFPEVKDSIAALDIQDAIIDGEIVALDGKGRSSFQFLQGQDMGQEQPPIVFYAFDLLWLNGKDPKHLPIKEGEGALNRISVEGRRIVLEGPSRALLQERPLWKLLSRILRQHMCSLILTVT
jgi:bifunctional non-homologous end joining protein LigD